MDQYEYIRIAHRVYDKGIRQIARETGHSRNTVRKVLKKEYLGYSSRQNQPFPSLGQHLTTIDKWLEGDKNIFNCVAICENCQAEDRDWWQAGIYSIRSTSGSGS